MRKLIAVIVLACMIGLIFNVSAGYAAEQENRIVKFFKNLINWPFNITKKGAVTVGKTAEKGIATTATTSSAAVETVTGKPEKIKDVIVEPLKGSAETAAEAVEGTLKTPAEGTIETFKE